MRGRPPRYTDRHRFMVHVLHLHGLSSERIAVVMRLYSVPMGESTIRWIVSQLPYRKAEMPRVVRQRFLDKLKAHRLDRNHGQEGLPDEFFIAGES
jgi:hypothetical protein